MEAITCAYSEYVVMTNIFVLFLWWIYRTCR